MTEYKYWNMAAYMSPYLGDDTEAMYLYARCAKSGSSGSFLLSEEPRDLDDGSYYNLLCGALSTEVDGQRSFSTLYGFSEIGPGWMRLNKIINTDGTQYWDMLSKAFRIGDDNAFLSYDQRDGLVLKGSVYQSPSGEIDYPEEDRGAYSDKPVYYPGDKVSYDGNVYKCISQTTPGISPDNTRYWKRLVAKGSNSFKSTVFIRTNAPPAVPVGGSYASPLPTTEGWSDGIPSGEAILWASTRIFSSDGKDPQQAAWTTPRQMTDTADFDVEFSSVASPSAPNGHPNTNAQWSDTQGTDTIWMATSTKRNGVWSAWSVSKIKGEEGKPGRDGIDGTDGEDGKDGDPGPRGDPRCTYRGDYDSSATYNASSKITDIVSIKNSDGTRTYYVAKVDDNEPAFKGKHPTNTAYWDTFGANFSSVATDLLMARKIAASEIDVDNLYVTSLAAVRGTIGGFTVSKNQINSNVYGTEGNYQHSFYIDSGKGEIGIDGSSIVTYKLSGGYKYGDDSACLYIRRDLQHTKMEGPRHAITVKAITANDVDTMVELECESSTQDSMTFLHCKHGSRDIHVGTKYFSNDSPGIWRTTLRLDLMPSVTQVNTESTSGTRYNVKWDSATGLLYIE